MVCRPDSEGIEDPATAVWLKDHACDVGQGYTYAKPMPPDEFIAFVQRTQLAVQPAAVTD